MNMSLFILMFLVVAIIVTFITHVITRIKISSRVHELEARNEVLEMQHIEVGLQLAELRKIKEQADERLFNMDKYLAVAIAQKELTSEQIAALQQQIERDRNLKEQLQLKIQEAGKLQMKAETELSEARKVIEEYQNKLTAFHRNPQ
jgi:hypothetical protein